MGGEYGNTRALVINGPGSIIGGICGIRVWSSDSTLIVNGGTIRGIMGHGITAGGIVYINGGAVIGNFGSIEYDRAIVVLNGGEVGKVNFSPLGDKDNMEFGYGVIRNGVFTGRGVLSRAILDVSDLSISEGSSIRVEHGGGLIVRNSFVNKGSLTYEGGLLSIGGEAVVKPNPDLNHHATVNIFFDVNFSSLDIQEQADLCINNGATVTVTGAFSTSRNSNIEVKNGTLKLLGSVDHKGRSEGVPELAALEDHDGVHGGGPDEGHGGGLGEGQERNFAFETLAARRLKALGLFQGIGTNPDGSTNFDLARAPSRLEALVMLVRLLGKDAEAKNGNWKHPFTDVPEWADKYVGYAYEKGLTKGSSATLFGTGTATAQMYLTFVLRALGYSDAEGGDFTWDKPEELAHIARILKPGINLDDFLRADVVLVSEAALSAYLKNSKKTLFDKLIEDDAVTIPDNSDILDALATPGNASITLTGDTVIDVGNIEIEGNKEIILNNFLLTLRGMHRVTGKSYLDIRAGEGTTLSAVNLSELRVDLSHLLPGLSGEIPLMEIHDANMFARPPDDGFIAVYPNAGGPTVITCRVEQ